MPHDFDREAWDPQKARKERMERTIRRERRWFIGEIGLALVGFAAAFAVVAAGVVTPNLPFVAGLGIPLGANAVLSVALLSLGVVAVPALLLYGGLTLWLNQLDSDEEPTKVSMLRSLRLGSALMPALFVILVVAPLPLTWPAVLGLAVLAPVALGLMQGVRLLWKRRQARLAADRVRTAPENKPVDTGRSVVHAPVPTVKKVKPFDPVAQFKALGGGGNSKDALALLQENIEEFKKTSDPKALLELTISSSDDALACRLFDAVAHRLRPREEVDAHGRSWSRDYLGEVGDGTTLLHQAVTHRLPLLVQKLLNEPAVVASENSIVGDETALHLAVDSKQVDMVRYLLEAKVAVDVPDRGGDTPLHRAARIGDEEVIRLLSVAGADWRKTNKKGETPTQLAERRREEIADAAVVAWRKASLSNDTDSGRGSGPGSEGSSQNGSDDDVPGLTGGMSAGGK